MGGFLIKEQILNSGIIFVIVAQNNLYTCFPNVYITSEHNIDTSTSTRPTVMVVTDSFPQDGCGERQDRGHGWQRWLVLHQDPVQLRGAVDQGAQVYAHQPEVGTGLGHLTVLQQINLQGIVIVNFTKTHTHQINGFHVNPNWILGQRKRNGYICITLSSLLRF